MQQNLTPLRIGIVAGEVSGDLLGAGLLQALRQHLPNATFIGIGGPGMIAQGCKSLYRMEKLSVIGFMEALGKFTQILKIRKDLIRYFTANPPDIFIGIDAPDFNLVLEEKLKQQGIPTLHYVSPTVWAWRGYRIKKIHKSVDHMLTLFPFEAVYYQKHNIPVTFVGHPLAEIIEEDPDKAQYRKKLALPEDKIIVGLLPGSRKSELHRHAPLFVKTVVWLHKRNPNYVFAVPFVNKKMRAIFNRSIKHEETDGLPIIQFNSASRDVMAASDVILLASGTAALEAALLKRLMVVTYKVSFITSFLVRMFSHVDLYSMPNHLAGRQLVPELMQSDATPENLGQAVEHLLQYPEESKVVLETLSQIHKDLKQNANEIAADSVCRLLAQRDNKNLDVSPKPI